MRLPQGIEEMSDEQARLELLKIGYDKNSAEYVLSVVRGKRQVVEDD